MTRENERYPTRQFPYRRSLQGGGLESAAPVAIQQLNPSTLYRFVMGIDETPQEMSSQEIDAKLQDVFGGQLLRKGVFPLSLRAILAAMDALNNDAANGFPEQRSFLVADGGQIRWSQETADVPRHFRFAIARSKGDRIGALISTSTLFDSIEQFLQLLAWDSVNEVFNYYERRGGTWIWAGNSYHALSAPSRGKGPFDSHANGSLVMKELKLPWPHWHSQASAITDDVLAPNDPLRNDPLWRNKSGAEDFETSIVRPGIDQWTKSRIRRSISSPDNGVVSGIRELMRQVLDNTTVNLIASDAQSRSITAGSRVNLPLSFFFNSDALIDAIGLDPNITIPEVGGNLYLRSLETFEFHLNGEGFRQSGDTHFAFLVPEAAFEDLAVLEELLRFKILSPKFAACLLIVDFANPISSARRAQLMSYVPEQAAIQNGVCDLQQVFVAKVDAGLQERRANNEDVSESVESEFLTHWKLGDDWRSVFERKIESYFATIKQRLQTQSGFDDYVKLAESRRREFRKRPLAEFDLTLPVTNIPNDAPALQMSVDGIVGPK